MARTTPRRISARWALSARRAGREVLSPRRLILALKTALAAALAWYVAPWLPYADSEYSYYAPLGVLVSMYPTVADSARAGTQALVGLACGITVGLGGLAIVGTGAPALLAVAAVVAAGVALGGIRGLGAGRDWIALAGLFVLLLSGHDADGFSSSYLLTMAFGVIVGVIANYLLVPPLYLRSAQGRLTDLRAAVTASIRRAADAVESGMVNAGSLRADADELGEMSATVASDVDEASRSERANVRARGLRGVSDENARRWWGLERTTYLTRDLLDVLAQGEGFDRRRGDTAELAGALRKVAELVATPAGDSDTAARLDDARRAIDAYGRSLHVPPERTAPDDQSGPWIVATLGRITDISRHVHHDRT